jgi:hypothetical protein
LQTTSEGALTRERTAPVDGGRFAQSAERCATWHGSCPPLPAVKATWAGPVPLLMGEAF